MAFSSPLEQKQEVFTLMFTSEEEFLPSVLLPALLPPGCGLTPRLPRGMLGACRLAWYSVSSSDNSSPSAAACWEL